MFDSLLISAEGEADKRADRPAVIMPLLSTEGSEMRRDGGDEEGWAAQMGIATGDVVVLEE